MIGAMDDVQISVVSGNGLTPAARAEILTFCCRAYGEDLAALFETFTGTTHVIGRYCRELASHACWVTRWLQPEGMAALRTAYVELVATAPEFRCRGYASRVMGRLAQEIADFDIGGLSPSRSSFYERLGWELWQGPL
ncbi:MAG: GNAT family N-acetyltransferase, partial [Candidatus Hydrogenedentes bacterium]|nr:GNAT family N-acetyltransferase [Candidatus Hydrogenedentota bacterium]